MYLALLIVAAAVFAYLDPNGIQKRKKLLHFLLRLEIEQEKKWEKDRPALSTPAELEWDKRSEGQEHVCQRCEAHAKDIDHHPFWEGHVSLRAKMALYAPEKDQVAYASTGCVLTDQIFAAARAKGIMPVDVIGPAPEYENFD